MVTAFACLTLLLDNSLPEAFRYTDTKENALYRQLNGYSISGDYMVYIELNSKSKKLDEQTAKLFIVNLATGKEVGNIENVFLFARPVISANGKHLLVQTSAQQATLYSVADSKISAVKTYAIPSHGSGSATHFLYPLAIDDTGKYFIETYGSQMVALYSMPEYKQIATMNITGDAFYCAKAEFSGDRLNLLNYSYDDSQDVGSLVLRTASLAIKDFPPNKPLAESPEIKIPNPKQGIQLTTQGDIYLAESAENELWVTSFDHSLKANIPIKSAQSPMFGPSTKKYLSVLTQIPNGRQTTVYKIR